jgi:hypothetical protein
MGKAPYSFTSGLEPTEYMLYMNAANTTADGPVICRKLRSVLIESITAPATANASINLFPIFSFKKTAESNTMKMGPKEIRSPARPDDTMVSA